MGCTNSAVTRCVPIEDNDNIGEFSCSSLRFTFDSYDESFSGRTIILNHSTQHNARLPTKTQDKLAKSDSVLSAVRTSTLNREGGLESVVGRPRKIRGTYSLREVRIQQLRAYPRLSSKFTNHAQARFQSIRFTRKKNTLPTRTLKYGQCRFKAVKPLGCVLYGLLS